MSKIKSIYDMLNSNVKVELQSSMKNYDSAKLLKYTLMSKTVWSELSIRDINDLMTYGNISSTQMSPYSFLYGDNIIKQ